jgi:hypothetical protein
VEIIVKSSGEKCENKHPKIYELEVRQESSNNSRCMGSSCPCLCSSSLFDGKFFFVNRVGHIQMREHHIQMMEPHIQMRELDNHNRMMELRN